MQKKSSADPVVNGDSHPSSAASTKSSPHPDHPRARKTQAPDAFQGVQVNYCKNPRCANYGVPIGKKASRKDGEQNAYRITFMKITTLSKATATRRPQRCDLGSTAPKRPMKTLFITFNSAK